ncbi:MAG: dTDP-4-dehydrorhamnose reductase [Mycobacterium sp.]
MTARLVITGAGGQVGSFLAGQARKQGRDVVALASAQWDISDPAAAQRHVESGDLVINCAAYTDVDRAESDPDRAYAVNAIGPQNIAHACARAGAQLVHLSTDYVFGGERQTPYDTDGHTNPLSVYGRSKRAGELAVLATLPDAHIVRTSWVYTGGGGTDFVAAMRRTAAGDGTVDMVADQIGSPTYVGDLVAALLELVDSSCGEPEQIPRSLRSCPPVLHAANAGAVSRYEQARAVFSEVGADPDRVRPVTSAAQPRPAARPSYSALSGAQWAAAGLTPLRAWREALHAALVAAGGPLPSTP